MKLKLMLLLPGICLLLSGCQKRKYPEEQIQLDNEEIYFNGYFGADPVNLKIGSDGYYCYSSYKQRSDSVYVFEGTLKKFDCNPCPQSFHVELTDYRQRLPGASVPVDSVLKSGVRNFSPGLSEASILRYKSYSNKEVASRRWQMSNGFTSEDSIVNCEFSQPGVQTVSLTVRTKGNCESTVINKVFVDETRGVFACRFTSWQTQNKRSLFIPLFSGGVGPFRYNWNFGDGNVSDLVSPEHTYKWAGSYPVKLTVTDGENHVCEFNYTNVVGNDYSSCNANMFLVSESKKKVSLNGIKIQWTDQSNVTFRSDGVVQPADSFFEILKSEEYAANEKGERGQLLTMRFNVLVSDGTRKVWLKSEKTAMAVTYK